MSKAYPWAKGSAMIASGLEKSLYIRGSGPPAADVRDGPAGLLDRLRPAQLRDDGLKGPEVGQEIAARSRRGDPERLPPEWKSLILQRRHVGGDGRPGAGPALLVADPPPHVEALR